MLSRGSLLKSGVPLSAFLLGVLFWQSQYLRRPGWARPNNAVLGRCRRLDAQLLNLSASSAVSVVWPRVQPKTHVSQWRSQTQRSSGELRPSARGKWRNPTQRLRQGHPFPYTERVTSTPRTVHPSLGRLYSQYGQEAFVWDRYATVIPHTFVEFGCRNGVEHSNTFAFEKIGWKGLCIEAIESIQLRKSVHHGSAIQVGREVR